MVQAYVSLLSSQLRYGRDCPTLEMVVWTGAEVESVHDTFVGIKSSAEGWVECEIGRISGTVLLWSNSLCAARSCKQEGGKIRAYRVVQQDLSSIYT